MSNLAFLKVLCGGAATAGTVGVGSLLVSDTSSEDSLATKKVNFEVQEQPEESEIEEPQDTSSEEEVSTNEEQISEEVTQVPETIPVTPPKCTLYVVREPKGRDRTRVVTEILEKVEEEQSVWLKDKDKKFREDVNKVCPAVTDKPKNIYVWKSTGGGWIYAGDISTQDWLSKSGVKVPKGWEVNSEGTAV
ncbi:hypothetical protein HF1_10550 [Mycoplasma haemofelis str. Langford 1]|uniref:Uncharacterized protein n=1 Tax=Mycoplasma haemofelis (strain Langford 1) TaxID=941640 RepID=E8ZIU2_MYCHL|nr:hypothetical protein [Mycoplasma haemofelis]CBY93063.1 hypothetical protein HF1_10550 [Mycoplasma haemofelis str. Langford 1]